MNLSPRAVEAAARAICCKAQKLGCAAQQDGSPFTACQSHTYRDDAINGLEAALAVDGLCLVPKEPTETMIEAGDDLVPVARGTESYTMGRGRNGYPEDIYRAMIAAASDGEDLK